MPVRLRLALFNAIVLGGVILFLSATAYTQLARSLADSLDESLQAQARNLATVYEARAALPSRAQRVIPQPSVFSSPSFLVQVLDPDGSIVERSSGLGNRQLPVNPETLDQVGQGEDVYETVTLDGQHVRLFTTALLTEENFLGHIQIAGSLEAAEEALEFLRFTLLRVGAAALVISMIVAWLLAGISLQPITRITRAAADIARSGRLDRRLDPAATRDEVARLVETFNRMMDRLETAFAAQRRFVTDASHELRTPLTTIRGNIEMLRRSGTLRRAQIRGALDDVVAESERMTRLVDGLLALARADTGHEVARARVQLDDLVRAVHREVQPVASQVSLELDTVEPTEVTGDPDALKQLLLILVDNGVKYTPPGGTVTLSLKRQDGRALLSVRDTGTGIKEEDLPHIFDRFYRSATARAREGTGLGLSIAQWIVQAHDGRIRVDSRPQGGSVFTVELPVEPATFSLPVMRRKAVQPFS